MRKKALPDPVTWLSDPVPDKDSVRKAFNFSSFKFKSIVASVGDFILVSNADSADPDTEEGCDAARILSLYENRKFENDPFRAKVQWYSRPSDMPSWCFNNNEKINFLDGEVIEDYRPFQTDVSIETFFKKCHITLSFTNWATDETNDKPLHYICRYRYTPISKRKGKIEPVLEQERKALELLYTPKRTPQSPQLSKTPTSLIKRMSCVSLSETKNWSISKTDGTKLLLKRAILADKIEKDSPKKITPIQVTPKKAIPKNNTSETPKSSKKMSKTNIEDMLMELQENSDDELPTLIIKDAIPVTPKRKVATPKSKMDNLKTTPLGKAEDKTSNNTIRLKIPKLEAKLKHASGDELPTLVIKESVENAILKTPKKIINEKEFAVTRSGRKTKVPLHYAEEELSPVKRSLKDDDDGKMTKSGRKIKPPAYGLQSPITKTPRSMVRKRNISEGSDDDFEPIPGTPKTPKTPRTPRTPRTARATPISQKKSVSRRILTSQLTPSLHSRAHSVENINDFGKGNMSLPGRESQMEEILCFVRTKLLDEASGCMYISGVPGTGKTATVQAALKTLQDEAGLPHFQLLEVNGMKIAEPRQAFVQIYKQLTGKSVAWEQACSLLEKRFTNPGPRRIPIVLLVDELDALCTRRQDVLYSIMEWASHQSALLTVLAVANTMDLPERALAARVASRLGLTRLTFPPYTHAQLRDIVAARLAGADVTPDAVQLIARKVAAVSGDARRALALCSRACELASASGGGGAGMAHVQAALAETAGSVTVRAISSCSRAEQLMLRAVASEAERTGSDETTLSRALLAAAALVSLEGRPYRSAEHARAPTASQALALCARLSARRLLILENRPDPKLLLNVGGDDVHYATRKCGE